MILRLNDALGQLPRFKQSKHAKYTPNAITPKLRRLLAHLSVITYMQSTAFRLRVLSDDEFPVVPALSLSIAKTSWPLP